MFLGNRIDFSPFAKRMKEYFKYNGDTMFFLNGSVYDLDEVEMYLFIVGAHANLLRSDPSMQLTADNRSFGETSVTATR